MYLLVGFLGLRRYVQLSPTAGVSESNPRFGQTIGSTGQSNSTNFKAYLLWHYCMALGWLWGCWLTFGNLRPILHIILTLFGLRLSPLLGQGNIPSRLQCHLLGIAIRRYIVQGLGLEVHSTSPMLPQATSPTINSKVSNSLISCLLFQIYFVSTYILFVSHSCLMI